MVDAWWKRFMPVYRTRDADAMLSLIRELIDEHPEVMNHCGLDQEAMVELASIFMDAEKADELTALLLEIRQDFPLLYDQTCGYTDSPLAALLFRQGRQDLIPSLLERFLAYGADCGYIKLFQEILIAGNCGSAAMTLGGKMKTFWPEWAPVFAALDRHHSSPESVEMVSLHMQSSLFAETLGVAEVEETLPVMFGSVEPSLFAPETLDNRALALIFSRYMMWLHEDRGLSWPSAMAFAHGACHCYHFSLDAERQDFWALSIAQLSSYVKGRFTRQWDSDAVATCTLYQRLYWLADFWQARGQEVDVRQDALQAASVKRVEGLMRRVPNCARRK
ncbi:MAG: hypothetical protein ACI8W8_003404 [Rhodothermales bacterium]